MTSSECVTFSVGCDVCKWLSMMDKYGHGYNACKLWAGSCLYCVNSRLIFKPTFLSHCILCLSLEIDRYIGLADILGRYLGFTDISASAIMAKCIGLSRCCQNPIIFLMHPVNLHKKAQQSKSRQLSYSNASRCVFMHK